MIDNEYRLMTLNREVSLYMEQLRANEEKVRRLYEAKSKISNEQEELMNNKRLIFKPELSRTIWSGKHANHFGNLRAANERAFKAINDRQIEELLTRIEDKILQLERANASISDSIQFIHKKIKHVKDEEG
ncbi:YwqH-like family protein [Fictibacillus gelatini]|uniref:YwqH-like family protein n=1 Tax=Fictibacillus gelatini TaxID=225985 RepID=UPI00042280A4|nr:DUF5082 family protein [Fictibacillus gelatini]